MITVKDILKQGRQMLVLAGRESAQLDTYVLLGHVLKVERATFYAYSEREITAEQEQCFLSLIERRKQGEPVAYLVGHKEFYGLDFLVDRRVLIPRPETERLVETALNIIHRRFALGQTPVVADIGTGSGAIAITLVVEEPRLPYIYASDLSSDALEVARLNCQRHHVEQHVRLLQGDLVESLPESVDLLIANLPYVGTEETTALAPDVRAYEPHLALFSGPQGLDLFQRFGIQVQQLGMLNKGAVILLEIGYQQSAPLIQLFYELWPQATITCEKDYAGWDRVLQISM